MVLTGDLVEEFGGCLKSLRTISWRVCCFQTPVPLYPNIDPKIGYISKLW
jgi:hypothetical protein